MTLDLSFYYSLDLVKHLAANSCSGIVVISNELFLPIAIMPRGPIFGRCDQLNKLC
jgi:hypothetical protein